MNRVLEFILRMRDEASAKIQAVKAAMHGTGAAAEKTKPGLEGMAGGLAKMTEGARRAQGALAGVLGTLGMVFAAFKAGQWIGNKLQDLTGNSQAQQDEKQRKILERAELAKKKLAGYENEEKARLEEINAGYERQAKALDRLTEKTEALAAARLKADQAEHARRMSELDAGERLALAQGYDPDAVRTLYGGERAAAQADAEVADAQSGLESAERAVQAAMDQHTAAIQRSVEFQDRLNQAEAEQAALRRKMNALYKQDLTDEERIPKINTLLFQYQKAERAAALARRGLAGAGEGESIAADAVDVARAEAEAARAAVAAAETARGKTELDRQIDVEAFWRRQDGHDAERQTAELAAIREQQDERRRLQDEADRAAHARRVEDVRAEAAAGEQAQAAAADRLARARAAADQAWSWYRDPEAFRARLKEERADEEARKRFGRDEDRLTRMRGWRTRELSDDQEAVRRVVLAREEERRAEQALAAIEKNTAGLEAMLRTLLTSK
jgi:hypothetical protein